MPNLEDLGEAISTDALIIWGGLSRLVVGIKAKQKQPTKATGEDDRKAVFGKTDMSDF